MVIKSPQLTNKKGIMIIHIKRKVINDKKETIKDTRKKIKSGEYKLTDLNNN